LKARFFLVIRQAETSKIWGQIRSLLTDIILLTNSIMFNFDFVCRNRKVSLTCLIIELQLEPFCLMIHWFIVV
jgi:hypothetical protein